MLTDQKQNMHQRKINKQTNKNQQQQNDSCCLHQKGLFVVKF